jgi:hypothetical protein
MLYNIYVVSTGEYEYEVLSSGFYCIKAIFVL